jgi:hypothetical protein
MARARININSGGMADLLKSSDVRDDLTARAERVLSAAQSSAPVASGAYRDSLEIVQATTDRAVVRVVADIDYGYVVEANTGNLSRALDSA